MLRTIKDVLALFPWTTEKDWKQHSNGNGWVQITASVDASCTNEGIVSGYARVSGDGCVFGDGWKTAPLLVQGSKHTATNCKYGFIAIGCQVHTFAHWQTHVESIARAHGYTEVEVAEYRSIVDFMVKLGK
jgi:hypothetical protein